MSIRKWLKELFDNSHDTKMPICYWANEHYKQCVYNAFTITVRGRGGYWYIGQAFMESSCCSHPFSAFWVVPYGLGYRAAVWYDDSFYWGDESFSDFKRRVANVLSNDKDFFVCVESMKKKNGGKWTW